MNLPELKVYLYLNSLSSVCNIEPKDCAEMLKGVNRASAAGEYITLLDVLTKNSSPDPILDEMDQVWKRLTKVEKDFFNTRGVGR